jgi:hypothetical protein
MDLFLEEEGIDEKPRLMSQHPQASAHDQQDTGQDHENAAASAANPRPGRPPRLKISAAAQHWSTRSDAHPTPSLCK